MQPQPLPPKSCAYWCNLTVIIHTRLLLIFSPSSKNVCVYCFLFFQYALSFHELSLFNVCEIVCGKHNHIIFKTFRTESPIYSPYFNLLENKWVSALFDGVSLIIAHSVSYGVKTFIDLLGYVCCHIFFLLSIFVEILTSARHLAITVSKPTSFSIPPHHRFFSHLANVPTIHQYRSHCVPYKCRTNVYSPINVISTNYWRKNMIAFGQYSLESNIAFRIKNIIKCLKFESSNKNLIFW